MEVDVKKGTYIRVGDEYIINCSKCKRVYRVKSDGFKVINNKIIGKRISFYCPECGKHNMPKEATT